MIPQGLQLPNDLRLLFGIFVPCLISLLASRSSRSLFALLAPLSAYALIRQPTDADGPLHQNYRIGAQWAFMLLYGSHLALLNDPLYFRHNDQKEPASNLPFLSRLWWAASLLNNPRGINWNNEIPALRRSKLPKWAFVRSRIGSAILSFLILDGLQFHAQRNPVFQPGNGVTMESARFQWQIWNTLVFYSIVALVMQTSHSLIAAAAVAVGWSSVDDWPTLFGPWRSTTTIRKFWGKTWHQSLRQFLVGHGKYVARRLNFPQGSAASAYTQLFAAFLLSGMLHSVGDWVAQHSVDGVKRTITFFLLQAVAITFEDMLIAGWRRLGVGVGIGEHPLLSYAWVLLWLTYSTPTWFDTMNEALKSKQLPFSPVRFLVKLIT